MQLEIKIDGKEQSCEQHNFIVPAPCPQARWADPSPWFACGDDDGLCFYFQPLQCHRVELWLFPLGFHFWPWIRSSASTGHPSVTCAGGPGGLPSCRHTCTSLSALCVHRSLQETETQNSWGLPQQHPHQYMAFLKSKFQNIKLKQMDFSLWGSCQLLVKTSSYIHPEGTRKGT